MATAFVPQPLTAPLNDDALKALKDLLPQRDQRAIAAHDRGRHAPTKRHNEYRDHLRNASTLIATVTADLNEAAYTRKTKHLKMKARRQKQEADADPDGGGDEEAAAKEAELDSKYEQFQKKSEELTRMMDLAVRGVIDDLNWLEEYPSTLGAVVEKAQDSAEEQRRNFEVRTATPPRRRAKQRRISDDDEDMEEGEDEEEEAEQDEQAAPRSKELPSLDPSETPHTQLSDALAQQTRQWNSQSLTHRYAGDNNYKGWKGALWDAQNPGDQPPPMPHESLWFAIEEGRSMTTSFTSTQNRQRGKQAAPTDDNSFTEPGEDEDEDTELQISAENTRIRCPITLLPYENPVTSKNCNHSYERTAIMQMLESSPVPLNATQRAELTTINGTARARREKEMLAQQPRRVQCPDAGCNVNINGEEDLFENALLKRRVARMVAKEAQKNAPATSDIEEDDEGDADVVRGTQRKPVGLGSSPAAPPSTRRRGSRRIKNERASRASVLRDSVVPNSQVEGEAGNERRRSVDGSQGPVSRTPRGTQILDLEDDD